MKQIRHGVFETNSSSTHSISISKPIPVKQEDIPINYELLISPYDDPCAYDDEVEPSILAYRTQMAKLRYIIHVIVSILEYDVPNKYLTEFKDEFNEKINKWGYKPTIEEKEHFADLFFNLPQFKWLKEIIYDKTSSRITIDYNISKNFPFWKTCYTDDADLKEIFGFDEDSWNDEVTFKTTMSDIIFNNEIVIYDKSIPYGCDEEVYEF